MQIQNLAPSSRREPREERELRLWRMLETVVDRLERVDAEFVRRDERILELEGRIAEQAANLSRLADARAEDAVRVTAIETGVAEAASSVSVAAIETGITKLLTAVEAGASKLVDVDARLHATEEHLTAAVSEASEALVGERQRIDQIDSRVLTLETTEAVEDLTRRVERIDDSLTTAAERTQTALDSLAADIERTQTVLDSLPADIERAQATADGLTAHVRQLSERDRELRAALDVTTTDLSERVAAVDRRMRGTLSQFPKRLMVDRSGDLVAINGEGETTVVGRVAGRDGTDGASVQDVRVEDGRMVIRSTDGRRMDVGAWPTVDPDAALRPIALYLHSQQTSGRQIAKLMGVSRHRVAGWLKNADAEEG